jgi:hypothetical protein
LVNLDRVGVDNVAPAMIFEIMRHSSPAKADSLGKNSSSGVPTIAGSFIASPGVVMELAAPPANKNRSASMQLIFHILELLP